MARKPNYSFERQERERLKANKLAQKAEAKQRDRRQDRQQTDFDAPDASTDKA